MLTSLLSTGKMPLEANNCCHNSMCKVVWYSARTQLYVPITSHSQLASVMLAGLTASMALPRLPTTRVVYAPRLVATAIGGVLRPVLV